MEYFLAANNDHFCGHKDITSVVVLESWLAAAVWSKAERDKNRTYDKYQQQLHNICKTSPMICPQVKGGIIAIFFLATHTVR